MLVIGDIHGCYKTLMALVAQFPKGEEICLVGDLVDRGKDSKKVVQWVIDNNIKCVQGNHEDMLLALDDLFFFNGGAQTVMSYIDDKTGLETVNDAINRIAADETWHKHRAFIKSLPYYLEFPELKNDKGQHLFVSHSSWRQIGLEEAVKSKDIMWARVGEPVQVRENTFHVFGHTPQPDGPRIGEHYCYLDTGCVFKRKPYGVLTGLQWPSMQIYKQENIED